MGCMGEGGALGRGMPGDGRGCCVTAGDCCVERAGVCGDARGEARREPGWDVSGGARARVDCGCCGEVEGDGSGESAGSGGTVRIRRDEADIDL